MDAVAYADLGGLPGRVALIDARHPASPGGRIPGSATVSVEDVVAPAPSGAHLAAPGRAAAAFGAAGVGPGVTAVVAGELGDPSAARVAWALLHAGHRDTRLLLESAALLRRRGVAFAPGPSRPEPAAFEPRPDPSVRAEAGDVRAGGAALLDARTPQEFAAGRIPGASSAPFEAGIPRTGECMAPPGELARLHAGVPRDRDVVCYCAHGHRASALFFQLRAAGVRRARVYDGSFTEWAALGMPVER